jgi:glycosyltransferase involved in cell wall biosynthesis
LKVLYITYYGLLKHLCQTQVIPYLEGLSADGFKISVLSFEERTSTRAGERLRAAVLEQRLAASGIRWHPLRYHKRPSLPATAYDVIVGTVYAAYLVRKYKIDAVHARNHIPALMALVLKRLFGIKLIFDLRGIMAEEYVDAGAWRINSVPFRLTKWVEGASLRRADGIVMLTKKIRDILRSSSTDLARNSAAIEIIPCCVDTGKYAAVDASSVRADLKLEGKLVLAYAGSLGGWYMAEEMVALFTELLRTQPNAHFLILTQSRYELIARILEGENIDRSRYTILTVASGEVPRYLAAGDLAVSFIKPCFSKLSSSPTKIGEYLASGLPIITNRGIGDVDELVERSAVGVLVDAFDRRAYRKALRQALQLLESREEVRHRCRLVAEEEFSLERIGHVRYRRVYERLGIGEGCEPDVESVALGGSTR